MAHHPLRLILDAQALRANWRTLRDRCGVATGAAIKADGYGLGARAVLDHLYQEGARDFFVATWGEAQALGSLPADAGLSVLHGLGPDDARSAMVVDARPVLNSAQQAKRWRVMAPERACDVMIETGMNRLGLAMDEIDALEGLNIDTVHSHLACADEPSSDRNAAQLVRFREARAAVSAARGSLANSAGIYLGRDYAFDLTRPGIALYGGAPVEEATSDIMPVVTMEAQILQLRSLKAGEAIGYNALFTADRDTPVAILNLGYADGYPRNLTHKGHALLGEHRLPVIGRVSMDLIAIDMSRARGDFREGDWLQIDYDLATVARNAGISQYEALTGLGARFDRAWRD